MVRQRAKSTSLSVNHRETSQVNQDKNHPTCKGSDAATKERRFSALNTDSFRSLFGFELNDLSSCCSLVRLLCRPSDPACLGTMRFLFGYLMMLDIVEERGLASADIWWGSKEECRFPLFNFLHPLPLQWMIVIYLIMLLGAFGIMLGFQFRASCLLFLGPYWYILLLDKTSWNNHSYLFGILAFLFAISDANRYWSIDALLNPKISNAHIPLWNYTLMRAQIFLVYFIAGLKKLDTDWVSGYSMQSLSYHWVFDPFRLLLTESQIDLYIVHLGGLFIDLSLGFLLFFNKTRTAGLLISTSFHLMNSQMFSIGMFPYAMLATQMLFCHPTWPRRLFKIIPPSLRLFTPEDAEIQTSTHCIYSKDNIKSKALDSSLHCQKAVATSSSLKHKLVSLFTISFIAWQCFLPFSHGITKGYNTWTNGLYGYSWDMMIHSWSLQHIRVTYFDKDTGNSGYLDPMIWTRGKGRWSLHGDMIKQYANCIAQNLKSFNLNNVEIYFDIWRSLNHRFQQRMVDPSINMVTAEWHPFQSSPWLMPLMTDLSDWRSKLEQIQASLDNGSYTNVVFVADFPGLYLENFIQEDFANTTLSVLAGKVVVEMSDQTENVTLEPEQSLVVNPNTYHKVYTISETPSCYMYSFVNKTEVTFVEHFSQFEEDINKSSINETLKKYDKDPYLPQYKQVLAEKHAQQNQAYLGIWDRFKSFFRLKYNLLRRSIRLGAGALYCLATNNSFHEFLNATYVGESKHNEKFTLKK